MSEEATEDSAPILSVDPEIKALLGLFDLPAFARRGQDLELSVNRLHARCRHHRETLLELVWMRLRQWSRVATGPDEDSEIFASPIDGLWLLSRSDVPTWATRPAGIRQRRTVARDLIASVQRFNLRWRLFLESLNIDPTNKVIDQYNRYYLLEKECVMGSARLASRHFKPVPLFTLETFLEEYPLLPVPELID
jgi:hypothetical protein